MTPIRPDEVQPLLLSMLKAFIYFAETHGIQYFAAGGTLLGAIRHHGFIPWDDDIDLFVKEDMAEKLLKLTRENPYIDEKRRYKILRPAVIPNIYPIIKIVDTETIAYEKNVSKEYACGLWIDVFRMSYWPNDVIESERVFETHNRIKKYLQLSVFGNLKCTKYKLIAPFAAIAKCGMIAIGRNSNYWSGKLYRLGSQEKTGYIGNLSWSSTMKDRYCTEWYDDVIETQFEDVLISVPSEYDKILTQFYGDYMQLPPEDKRVRHGYEAYYVD